MSSSSGHQHPRSTWLQHDLSSTPHQTAGNFDQTAGNNSTSAYAAPAVANKVQIDSANTTGPPDDVSAVLSGTGCDVHDSQSTEPVPGTSAPVAALKDEHAALTPSIPGQVDAQEHRSDSSLTLVYASIVD